MRLLRILLALALSSCTGLVVEGADTTDAAGSETTSGADDSATTTVEAGTSTTVPGTTTTSTLPPESLSVETFPVPEGSRPHDVAPAADGGLNNIYSVDPETGQVTVYPIPDDTPGARLNTATFAADGNLWFTGQGGIYGMLDLASGETDLYRAPEGPGPYGITTTPDGIVYYAS